MPDDEVPTWCAFFTAEEFDAFDEAVDDALSAFGADGQDISEGSVELACGAPTVEVRPFSLATLAARCREAPRANWETVCFGVINKWVDGTHQREWLNTSTFPDVAHRLRVWISSKPPLSFETDPTDPAQPFSVVAHDAYCVSWWVQVPELPGMPSIPEFVPNTAVEAWGVSTDDLLDATRDHLRRSPGPVWNTITVNLMDDHDETEASVDLQYLLGEPDSDPPPAAWALIVNEVAPQPIVPETILALPARQLLLLSYPQPDLDVAQQLRAIAHHADHAWNTVTPEEQLSPWDYRCAPDGDWLTVDRT